jgi:transitional endoplasmic reticulum ATPase
MSGRTEKVRLRVGDARLEDVAEGRARLSRELLPALGLKRGDRVRVTGAHSILATALPADPEDDGMALVRLDGTQRRKAGVSIGGTVEVQRHDVRPASKVQLVAVGDSDRIELSTEDLRRALAEAPIITGDTVGVTPRRREFYAQLNVLGLNLAEIEGASSECGSVLFHVVATTPAGVVQVTEHTEIELLPTGT